MEKIFIFAIVFMFIILIATFFFVSLLKTGMSKNVKELRLELDKARYPIYHPLGLSTAFLKAILSFISLFLPGS